MTDTLVFLGAMALAFLWLVYNQHSEDLKRWLYPLSVLYSVSVHFFIVSWLEVGGLSVSPIPYIAAGIVIAAVVWASLQHRMSRDQLLFYVAMSSFPVVMVCLAIGEPILGDVWLTGTCFLFFTIPAALLLRHHALKLPAWTGYGAIGILVLYRFFSAGQFGERSVGDLDLVLLFLSATVVGGFVALVHSRGLTENTRAHFQLGIQKWSVPGWVDGIVLAGLLFLTLMVTGTNLSGLSFQNDEYYHVNTALGLRESGDFVQWNAVDDAPLLDADGEVLRYDRARAYTLQTTGALAIFGLSESALRLPSVMWFMIFIAGAYIVIRVWTKNIGVATVTVLAFVFLDHFILHARIVRMYSMLLVVGNAAMLLWYACYRLSMAATVRWFRLVAVGILAVLMSLLAIETHFLFLIFFPAWLLYLIVELIWEVANDGSHRQRQVAGLWVLLGVVIVWLGAVAFQVFNVSLLGQFIGWRPIANFQYELIPFSDQPIVALVIVLYLVGIIYNLRHSSGGRFISVVSVAVILLFTFAVKRYNAMRYILFIMPMALTVASVVLYYALERLSAVFNNQRLGRGVTVLTAILIFVPITLPGVPALWGLTYEGRSEQVHVAGIGHDVRTAYAYVKGNRSVSEPIFAQSFRGVYWGVDKDLEVINLGEQQSLTLKKLKKMVKEHEAMWFIWPAGKAHHLTRPVRKFIAEQAEYKTSQVPELKNSNVEVYYWQRLDTK